MRAVAVFGAGDGSRRFLAVRAVAVFVAGIIRMSLSTMSARDDNECAQNMNMTMSTRTRVASAIARKLRRN